MSLPEPYYQDESVTLYCGDCRDILPKLEPGSVDLVLTDPPFYLPARISAVRKTWPRSLSEVSIMESYFRDVFAETTRVLVRTGAFYTFSDSTSYAVFLSLLYPLFDRTQCIVWDKGRGGLGNGWRHSHELIAHGVWDSTQYADGFRRNVLQYGTVASADRDHASEKPIPLLTSLIAAHPPGVVFDPFAGAGTTLRAAKDLGRKAIGIEMEERYCEAAARRLAQSVLPLELVS